MLDDRTIGTDAVFIKTITEADVVLFAGISGDFNENHTNEEFMSTTRYGTRIAHGALLIALMSTASTKLIDRLGIAAVSFGYDGIRFLKPVYFGDTLRTHYQVAEMLRNGTRTRADINVTNQHGDLIAVGSHFLHLLEEIEGVEK